MKRIENMERSNSEMIDENVKNIDTIEKIDLKDGEFLIYIDVWISPILEKAKNQSIKKTLTIPKWLNDEAEKHSLNFSNILQTALKETLGL